MNLTATRLQTPDCPYKFQLEASLGALPRVPVLATLTHDLLSNSAERDLLLVHENDVTRNSLSNQQRQAFNGFKRELAEAPGGNLARFKSTAIGYFDQPAADRAVAAYKFGPVPAFKLPGTIQLPSLDDQPTREVKVAILPRLPKPGVKSTQEADLPLLVRSYGQRFERLMDKYFEDTAAKLRAIRTGTPLWQGLRPAALGETTLGESIGTKLRDIERALRKPPASPSRREVDFIMNADEAVVIEAAFARILAQYLLNGFYLRTGKADHLAYYEHTWQGESLAWQERLGATWTGPTHWLRTTFELCRDGAAPDRFDAVLAGLGAGSWRAEFVAFAQFLAATGPSLPSAEDIPSYFQGLLSTLDREEKLALGLSLRLATTQINRTELVGGLRSEFEIQAGLHGDRPGSWSKLKAEQKQIETEIARMAREADGFGDGRRQKLEQHLLAECLRILKDNYGITPSARQMQCLRDRIGTWTRGLVIVKQFGASGGSPKTLIADLGNTKITVEALRDRIAVGAVPFDDVQIDAAVNDFIMAFANCLDQPGNQEPIPNATELAACLRVAYEASETQRKQDAEFLVRRWRDLSFSERKGRRSQGAEKLFARLYAKVRRLAVAVDGKPIPLLEKENIGGRSHYLSGLRRIIAGLCQDLDEAGISAIEAGILAELIGAAA